MPGNSTITVPGKLSKLVKNGSYLVESAVHNNLPSDVVVNHSYATSKAGQVVVILINTTSRNIWICQPLLAAKIYEVELHPWQYKSILHREGNTIKVGFQPVVPPEVEGDLQINQVEVEVKEEQKEPLPSFGPRPDTTQDYDFKDEVEKLPFKFNLGDVPFSKEQKDRLLNLIYDHQKVFSLHDEDLGFCTKLAHSIATTTEKPVYLPHRTIPRQLQGEVRKCLDTWLRQGIIRPSKSPYASQVVIVRKKTSEIRLCVDYWKLNSIVVRDAFPLPRINEALQAVHNCQWFTSIVLAQGYLQMPVEEADIPKTAFRAGSSGLHEFTCMPFGLSNSGSSFCHLMEMCLGDQQFVTLLLYLDNICIFAASKDETLDHIELVFKQLEEFNLKIKPKKCHFFQQSIIFLGHVLSAGGISANPEKVEKVKNWPVPTKPKELQSFLGLASYYCHFIPKFAAIAKCLHQLLGPANHQKSKKNKANIEPVADSQLNRQTFLWTGEHQEAFDLLKACLTSAPVLGYPDFNHPFELEMDASLQGLGAVLSQRGKTSTSHVITFASRSLWSSEQSMCNYSSAKLELLALKWAVTEKFRDYLLGSKFTVYTENNPLAYVKESKLGVAQIRWLSKLALFDFDIKYRSGKLNQAADALSHRPMTDEILSDTESDGYKTISYAVMCDDLSEVLREKNCP